MQVAWLQDLFTNKNSRGNGGTENLRITSSHDWRPLSFQCCQSMECGELHGTTAQTMRSST